MDDLALRLRPSEWIIAFALLLSGCVQHRQNVAPASTPSIAKPTIDANTAQSACVQSYAIFSSKKTGRVRLNNIVGNGHQCSATKLFIGLADRSDLPMFVKLIQSHQVLDSAMIDDPTSGHQVYKLRGVVATGKSEGPLITLVFTTMNVTGCDQARPSSVPARLAPPAERKMLLHRTES
jgi:hypothetical protein